MLRSSAELAAARHRSATARTREQAALLVFATGIIDTHVLPGDDAAHAQAVLGFPETV